MSEPIEEPPTEPIREVISPGDKQLSPQTRWLQGLLETALRANALYDLEEIQIVLNRDQFAVKHEKTAKQFSTKLALLSVPISVRKQDEKAAPGDLCFERFDHFDVCVRHPGIPDRDFDKWCRKLAGLYSKAAENGAAYICGNELGFPSFWCGRTPIASRRTSSMDFALSSKSVQRSRHAFETELQEISTGGRCVIMPGTFHDPQTFENMAPTYFPLQTDSWFSRKYTSAYSVGEFIKVARSRKIPVYTYGSTVFCVLICSDAFDLNIFFRHVIDRMGPDKQKNVELYFVPSYHTNDPAKRNSMIEACRQLSEATGSIVVFVAQYVSKDSTCKAVFMCGEKVFESSSPYLSYYTINWRSFYRRLQKWLPGRMKTFSRRY